MRLPRSLSGAQLAALLGRRYGYRITRQRGSHLRLASAYRGYAHHVTIPNHSPLKLGTLRGVLGAVAEYLGMEPERLATELFGE